VEICRQHLQQPKQLIQYLLGRLPKHMPSQHTVTHKRCELPAQHPHPFQLLKQFTWSQTRCELAQQGWN